MRGAGVGTIAAAAALLVARRRLVLVRVVGESMVPWAADGDRVLVLRGRRPRPGDVVVGRPPGFAAADARFVKRAERFVGTEAVWVRGDGASSVDSRSWGPVPMTDLVGVVIARPRWLRADQAGSGSGSAA